MHQGINQKEGGKKSTVRSRTRQDIHSPSPLIVLYRSSPILPTSGQRNNGTEIVGVGAPHSLARGKAAEQRYMQSSAWEGNVHKYRSPSLGALREGK